MMRYSAAEVQKYQYDKRPAEVVDPISFSLKKSWTQLRSPMPLVNCHGQLLHIHEQVSLQDVLAFFVLLRRLVGLVLCQPISVQL